MTYLYFKNGQLCETESIEVLIEHSYPFNVDSPEKTAHYEAVAPIIFSDAKLPLAPAGDSQLGQEFTDFLAHYGLVRDKTYSGVDLLYLLSLSHDSALRAGIWSLGSQSHSEATSIIRDLCKLDAAHRASPMAGAISKWQELFQQAQSELQRENPKNYPDSTGNMLSLMLHVPVTSDDNTNNSSTLQDKARLEVEQQQINLLERAYNSYCNEEEDEYEYHQSHQQYNYY